MPINSLPPITNLLEPDLEVPESSEEVLDKDSLLNYTECHDRLKELVSKFKAITSQCESDRALRKVDIDVAKERRNKKLKEDEILVPVRVIDTNIRRETPPTIAYLKQSKRLITFKATNNPQFIPDRLEQEFYTGMTYLKWERPWMKVVDGSKTHGFDWVEVVYDKDKPFKVAIEHVGKDRLVFPIDAEDIQNCELIARVFKVSPRQLKRFVKDWGFAQDQVDMLLDKGDKKRKELKLTVYKVMFKIDDVVYIAWDSLDLGHEGWLKEPQKLFLGRRSLVEMPNPQLEQGGIVNRLGGMLGIIPQTIQDWQDTNESLYPVFCLPFQETEEEQITDVMGRVFLDKHKQEAATSNLSSFLNNLQRTANVYSCLENNTDEGTGSVQAVKFQHGTIIPRPIKFFTPPAASPAMLAVAHYLETLNAAETGQVSYAVNNRHDTEKTATEVASARQDQGAINTVSLTLFSTFVREVYSFIWLIVQSQALQHKINLLQIDGVNDTDSISLVFDIRAAGDTDVIERQELIQKYKEFWPIVANTPLAMTFLEKLLKLSFPNDGDTYSKILAMGDPIQLLTIAGQVITGILQDFPDIQNRMPPDQQAQLAEFINAISGVMASQQEMQQGNKNKISASGNGNGSGGNGSSIDNTKPKNPQGMMTGGANGGMGNIK